MIRLQTEKGEVSISDAIIPHEEGDISIELHIVVEHGVNIAAVCRSIINQVRYMVSENTGASIRSIDVCVDSMNM